MSTLPVQTASTVNTFYTLPAVSGLAAIPDSKFKVFSVLRMVTYGNKNFLLLTGAVRDAIMKHLSYKYSSFKPIKKIINWLQANGFIQLTQSEYYTKITFLETRQEPSEVPIQTSNIACQGSKLATPIYISKRTSKRKEEDIQTSIAAKESSFIPPGKQDNIYNQRAVPAIQPTRMNEPCSTILRTGHQTKPEIAATNTKIIDNAYIKTLEQLPEFRKYSTEDQATIHRFIHKAKARKTDTATIDAYCRSIIFNKQAANVQSPKYKPIQNIKNYSYSALFGNTNIYHRIDNPAFPYDLRTQEDIKKEQRQRETAEQKTVVQKALKVVEEVKDVFAAKISHLQEVFKDNLDALIVKAKEAVAAVKGYNPLFVPELEAVEELYTNLAAYAGYVKTPGVMQAGAGGVA